MSKPIVHFTGEPMFLQHFTGVLHGDVYAVDHPRLGRGWVRTSTVIYKNDDGSFETMNSIYVPVKDNSDDSTD